MANITDEDLDNILDEASDAIQDEAAVGRTTKNTDPWALGQNIGQSFRMVT